MTKKRILLWREEADMGMQSMLLGIAMILIGYVLSLSVLNGTELRNMRHLLQSGLKVTTLASAMEDISARNEADAMHYAYDEALGEYRVEQGEAAGCIALDADACYARYGLLAQKNLAETVGAMGGGLAKRLGTITPAEFIVYNVGPERVTVTHFDAAGRKSSEICEELSVLTTPSGDPVSVTSIYVRVSFSYRDLFGRKHDGLSVEEYCAVRRAG